MSTLPPYQNLNYGGYGTPTPNPRPGAVTGIAITGIVLACMGLACNVFGLFGNVLLLANGGRNPLAPQLPAQSHTLVLFAFISACINLAMWGWLLAASIGGMRLRPVARTLMIQWAIWMMVWHVVMFVFQLMVVIPETANQMSKFPATAGAPNFFPAFTNAMRPFMYVSAIVSVVLYCVLPVLILILWRKPNVKAAFSGQPIVQ